MKKVLCLILSICLMLTCVGCGSDEISDSANIAETSNATNENNDGSAPNNELLTYFNSDTVTALTEISSISGFDLSTSLFDEDCDQKPTAVLFFTVDSLEGNDAEDYYEKVNDGGCIEIFEDTTMAERRKNYLTGFFFFGLTGGEHDAVNKYVIQISEELSDDEQKNIINELTNILDVPEGGTFESVPADNQDQQTETTKLETMADTPDVWTNLLEKHYEEVKKQFEDAGFTNITCVAHEIDFNENNVFEGSVVNIAVGENGEICTFEKGEQWPKDIKIRIDYRVKPADLEITVPTDVVIPLNECQVGDVVEFGSYPHLADGTKEPIRWLVLKVDGNKALLISCDILDAVQYHDEWEEITWENCALRKWLNDDFYNAAFSSSEKNQIVKVTNNNPDNNYSGYAPISGGYDTTDRVFVLCTDEIVEYFEIPVRGYHNPKKSYENLASEWTEYANSQQDSSVEYGYTGWFTRSPGSTRKMVAIVSAGGYAFNAFGVEGHQGVRPVIWVELD